MPDNRREKGIKTQNSPTKTPTNDDDDDDDDNDTVCQNARMREKDGWKMSGKGGATPMCAQYPLRDRLASPMVSVSMLLVCHQSPSCLVRVA
ncbi:hypothetical protein VTJ04DRAFT_1709 [Mycothermus thermophilus]|uniref:uncharacterized protein n=1 Tax=Humicola insolens TaxID=85995 RepID=UPI0037429D88